MSHVVSSALQYIGLKYYQHDFEAYLRYMIPQVSALCVCGLVAVTRELHIGFTKESTRYSTTDWGP